MPFHRNQTKPKPFANSSESQDEHSCILRKMWDHFDERFDTLEERLDKRFDTLERRFKTLDAKIDSVLKRRYRRSPNSTSPPHPRLSGSTTPAICPSFAKSSRWCWTYCPTT